MTATRQPKSSRATVFAESLRRFRSIFVRQYSALAFGARAPRAQSCPCQKHPLTKMSLCSPGKTRSGFPGRSSRCNRKRKPMPWTSRRTINSGAVSLPFTARMIWLRCSGVSFKASARFSGLDRSQILRQFRYSGSPYPLRPSCARRHQTCPIRID